MAWNPSERDQSALLLMQGLSGAGQSLGAGVAGYGRNKRALEIMAEERAEKAKDEADMGKASEVAFRVMSKQGLDLGIDEAEFKNLGAREKSAAMLGVMKSLGAREVMQRVKLSDAKIAEFMRGQKNERGFNQDIEQMMTRVPYAPGRAPVDPQAMMGAAAKRGMVNMGNIDRFLGMQPGAAASKKKPEMIEIDGRKMVWSPETGRYDFMPAEPAPAKEDKPSAGQLLQAELQLTKRVSELYKEMEGATPTRQRAIRNEVMALNERLGKLYSAPEPGAKADKGGEGANADKLLQEANEAIRKGADPEKVKARLKEMGVNVQ